MYTQGLFTAIEVLGALLCTGSFMHLYIHLCEKRYTIVSKTPYEPSAVLNVRQDADCRTSST